jgi:tryptophanyl-tRNA synthetase
MMSMSMQRVLSGVQTTGTLHLGNYLGAIRNWVPMQAEHECLFMLADLHAITVPQDPELLRQRTRQVAASYIACGIDPKKSIIFAQSHVPMHAELAWILNCHTPLGWLNRMTQFKEKSGKHKENASLGLYAYPVLQAADIIGYHALKVPVGEDQKQHLELARDIAGAFNRAVGEEFFPLPEPLIMGVGARIMSLRDGTKKMSKSDPSDQSRIHLLDTDEQIADKIKRAKSDMLPGITRTHEGPQGIVERPEAANLLSIFATITNQSVQALEEQYASAQFSTFKSDLADALITHLAPIRAKLEVLLEDTESLDGILQNGAERADEISAPIVRRAKELCGFLVPKKSVF